MAQAESRRNQDQAGAVKSPNFFLEIFKKVLTSRTKYDIIQIQRNKKGTKKNEGYEQD